jgi:hypothetical protein
VQGANAYIPNAVQIGGAAQTVKWLGSASAPTGNANKVDIVSFTLVRVGSAWAQVLVTQLELMQYTLMAHSVAPIQVCGNRALMVFSNLILAEYKFELFAKFQSRL